MRVISMALAMVAMAALCFAATPFPSKAYGYVPINSTYGSALFYALLGDDSVTPAVRATRPLVIYLQGGPGASSLFGAYLENGPQKINANGPNNWTLTKRVHTWTNHANMLYIDNPVGTGFSYTNDPAGYSVTDDQIADNLVIFMKGFLVAHPEYKTSPLWVFCESYGGKMTAYFGAALMKAVNAGEVPANFKGVALGDGWVDPVGCMYSYGPYLKAFSQLTDAEVDNITRYAAYAKDALEENRGVDATNWWNTQQNYIGLFTNGINWYNSLYYYDYTADNQFQLFGQSTLAQQLGSLIPKNVTFGGQGNNVFSYMSNSFMRDGVRQVQQMLDGNITVHVYGGQVDLIVDTLCIQGWISKLNWAGLEGFNNAWRESFNEPGQLNMAGFVQRYKNFAFWQINQAGHMVPLDQPWAAEYMLSQIIGSKQPIPPSSSEPREELNGKRGKIHMRKHRVAPKP